MRPATQQEVFILVGQAMVCVQTLEECLSVATTLKVDVGHPRNFTKAEADELLKKRRAFTLGKAIKEAQKKNLYSDNVQKALEAILEQRNWLVHKNLDDIYDPNSSDVLVHRLRYIAWEANRIKRAIEDDLILFSESNGLDMSHVRAAIKAWDHVAGSPYNNPTKVYF